jgi:hypothetical protein
MGQEDLRQLAIRIINKEKWWDILSRFIEVLRMNIFVVDSEGGTLLPPEEGKYGGRLLTQCPLGFIAPSPGISEFLKRFKPHGPYWEYSNPLQLYQFAIPININGNGGGSTIAYMIVGPVILNKRLENAEYVAIAKNLNINFDDLINEINGLRIVSNVMMSSILDLLHEIVKNNIELSGIKRSIYAKEAEREGLPREIKEAAKELYSTVCLDELLVTLLDIALKMTHTQYGSIMIADEEKGGDLVVKVSRGLSTDRIQNARLKIGEGIAGWAAREKSPLILHGQEGTERIKPLLKRPEVKHALVMPLLARNRVFGVLNLHTQEEQCNIENNLENLQYLSRLLSSVV